MTATQAAPPITGYLPGTWDIDLLHSEIGFSIRHMMVTKVKGRFLAFSGFFVTGENPFDSSVQATVDLSSISTGNTDRDAHLRSADFFDVDQHTTLEYRSTGIRYDDDEGFIVDGELTLRGVTKQVPLALEIHGFQQSTPFGDTRTGFTATGEIDRRDFGVSFNSALEGGGVALANKVQIILEVQAILRQPASAGE
jgi:polyisoprenoid-binding protein YceI